MVIPRVIIYISSRDRVFCARQHNVFLRMVTSYTLILPLPADDSYCLEGFMELQRRLSSAAVPNLVGNLSLFGYDNV